MDNTIGKNIKELRTGMGVSQTDIAHYLDMEEKQISRIENGEEGISSYALERISCLFGIPVKDLESQRINTFSWHTDIRDFSVEEMEAIEAVNRIALNSEHMAKMKKRRKEVNQ